MGAGRVNAFKAVQAAALAGGTFVDSARNFFVTQTCGLATLTWTKNNAANQVIIAASDTLLFGTPSGTLQVGDVLPGRGTIIYKGSGTTTSSLLTVNQRRYFRIWSFNGTNYSFSKTSSALYSTYVGPLTVTNSPGCNINLTWTDSLACSTDSVMLIAGNKIPFVTPSGIFHVGDTVSGGGKVIYKGRGKSFNYITSLDSNVYVQKWNFNASHIYVNPFTDSYDFAAKPNIIQSLYTDSLSDYYINVKWKANPTEQCFGGDAYLLAYSTNDSFGNPVGTYPEGANITGGGTVLYIGPNTNFLHTELQQNSPYCYKVWKMRNQSEYSFGKTMCSRTLCANSTIIPDYTESFDGDNFSDPDICHWQLIDSSSRSNALKIVVSGTNPTVSPVQGSAMLFFNAYSVPKDKTCRLSSTAIKKGVGTDVDLLFRWYQDSSQYADESYAGEGVMVQWSTDRTNWQNLEFYPRVPDGGLTGWSYKQITLPAAASARDSVYISLLFTSKFGNNLYLDNLKINYSSYKATDGVTNNAVCESTDSTSQWTNYYDSSGNRLLSIKKYAQEIGKAGQKEFAVSVGGSSQATLIAPNNNYVTNPGGWLTMKRFYSFKPLTEPTQNLNIRFYYFKADFTAISNSANSLLSPVRPSLAHNDLYAWKINDISAVYNADPAQGHVFIPAGTVYNTNGYTQYVNTSVPDTNTWRHEDRGNNLHSMEYLVKHSGGGGLGIGSTRGRGALQLLTYTFTGNGNWSTSVNWQASNKPPALLPSNGRIVINPAGTGECVLDVQQRIPAGAELIVTPSKKFRIKGNLQVK